MQILQFHLYVYINVYETFLAILRWLISMAKKGSNTETAPMSWDQFQNLISRIKDDIETKPWSDQKKKQLSKFLLLISIGCYCGLRGGDILKLRWYEIHEKETLELIEEKTMKKRQITINNYLKNLITKYITVIKPDTINDLVFTNKDGLKAISIQYTNRYLKNLFKEYNIKVKNPSTHTLRKTFGLRVYEMNFKSDDALITLSQIFNHSNTAITRRYIGLQGKKIENIYLSL